MIEITQQTRDKLNEIIDRGLCHGIGEDGPTGQVCIEQAISIAIGEEPKDEPTCVHPVVRAHSVRLNDARWSSPKVRADSMRAYALNQLGCRAIDGQRFAEIVALRTVTELLPVVLRLAGLEEHAKNCEAAKDLPAADAAARYAAARYAAAAAAADADAILILATKIANEALEQCLAEAAA